MALRPLRFLHRTNAAPETSIKPLERTRVLTEIVLNDDMLAGLSRRNDLIAEFPFLRITQPPQQTARGSCKKCNQSATQRAHVQTEMQRIRQALAALPAEKKSILKSKLSADKIVLYHKTVSNSIERLQF